MTKLLQKKITVTIDRQRRRMAVIDVMNQRMIERALQGDVAAYKAVISAFAVVAKAFAEIPPTRAEMERDIRQNEARQALSAKLVVLLEEMAVRGKPERTRYGRDGKPMKD